MRLMQLGWGLCALALVMGCAGQHAGVSAPVEDWSSPVHKQVYRVERGDTLYSVAWAFGLEPQRLAQWNQLAAPYHLHQGQIVSWPTSHHVVSTARPQWHPKPHAIAHHAPLGDWLRPVQHGRLCLACMPRFPGVAFLVKPGTPVRAARAGQVVYVGRGIRGYGAMVLLKHGARDMTAYAYNQAILVSVGQHVRRGQVIAKSGRRSARQSLLYFERRYRGHSVPKKTYRF